MKSWKNSYRLGQTKPQLPVFVCWQTRLGLVMKSFWQSVVFPLCLDVTWHSVFVSLQKNIFYSIYLFKITSQEQENSYYFLSPIDAGSSASTEDTADLSLSFCGSGNGNENGIEKRQKKCSICTENIFYFWEENENENEENSSHLSRKNFFTCKMKMAIDIFQWKSQSLSNCTIFWQTIHLPFLTNLSTGLISLWPKWQAEQIRLENIQRWPVFLNNFQLFHLIFGSKHRTTNSQKHFLFGCTAGTSMAVGLVSWLMWSMDLTAL